MKSIKPILVLLSVNFVVSCGSGERKIYDAPLFQLSKIGAIQERKNLEAKAATVSENCIVSSYQFRVTDANGDLLIDRVDQVRPDFSKIGSISGSPSIDRLISAFNIKESFTLPFVDSNAELAAAQMSFIGVVKLCDEIWGGAGKISTLTTQFYGGGTFDLTANSTQTSDLCSSDATCLVSTSYASPLIPSKLDDSLQSFIDNDDKKNFVPVRLLHTGVDCKDDAASGGTRNKIAVEMSLGSGTEAIVSDFKGTDANSYELVENDENPTVLVSLIPDFDYKVTFTQGSGTGCTLGKTNEITVKIAHSEVFDASQNRIAQMVDRTVAW